MKVRWNIWPKAGEGLCSCFPWTVGKKLIIILRRSNYLVWICQNCQRSEKYVVHNFHKVLLGVSEIKCGLKIQCVFKSWVKRAWAGKLDLFICPVRWKTNIDSEPLLTTASPRVKSVGNYSLFYSSFLYMDIHVMMSAHLTLQYISCDDQPLAKT